MNKTKQVTFRTVSGAVLLLCFSAAKAQSSVTLYGQLDAGFLYTNKTVNPATGQNAGKQFSLIDAGNEPSVFGIKGSEDLGDRWSATFQLESGISLVNGGFDNSNGNFFGREAWVGLENEEYGKFRVGLQYSPFNITLFELDPTSYQQVGGATLINIVNYGDGFFVSNSVTYTSPKIAGFTASALYALGGVAGNFSAGRQYSASLKYELGGLVIEGAIDDEASSTDTAVNTAVLTTPVDHRTVGAAYSFANVTVKASWASYNGPLRITDGVRNGGDNDSYNIGLMYHVTPELDLGSSVFYVEDMHDSSSHAVLGSVSLQYFLSKETSLYTEIGITNNSGTESFGTSIDNASDGVRGTTMAVAVGMTHTF